jgi:kynurenine 3-monooxygenase
MPDFEDISILYEMIEKYGDDYWKQYFRNTQNSRKLNADAIAELPIAIL